MELLTRREPEFARIPTRSARLPDIYRELLIAREDINASSGRNETTNTVAIQLDGNALRLPYADERRRGIALVQEVADGGVHGHGGSKSPSSIAMVRADLAYAYAHDSCVRAIVRASQSERWGHGQVFQWTLLPNLGQVVELDEEAGTYKIVFFDRQIAQARMDRRASNDSWRNDRWKS